MIAIVDYGVGNLFSLASSFAAIGADARVTADPAGLRAAERIVLPGVGAFGDAAKKLRASGLAEPLIEEARRGKPVLGICLGMQLLFERGFEYGEHEGLSLIPGSVRPIADVISPDMKIPHIGWNALRFPQSDPRNAGPLFAHTREEEYVYFVHSYAAFDCDEFVTATTEYGGAELTAAVQRAFPGPDSVPNVFGCQFHPEKSGTVGLDILRAFCSLGDGQTQEETKC
ncbi:MAG: imidazole glycerol phosphate synthase subunit HisH [Synergistaceae bacterium]|nr:imidazole glycerol phosphate synthase subunit HisH [Synergistaceae bacterium]